MPSVVERNPAFSDLIRKMQAIHDRKSNDYATAENPYSNFEFAGQIGAMFSDPVDIAFAVLIGVKVARLAELRGTGKTAQNESVADTHLDLATYAALWGSYDPWQKAHAQPEPPLVSMRNGFMDTAGNWVAAPYEQ